MKAVSGATNTEPKQSSAKRYGLFAAAVVGLFFMWSLSSGGSSNQGDNLRSGQATRPTELDSTASLIVDTSSSSSSSSENDDDMGGTTAAGDDVTSEVRTGGSSEEETLEEIIDEKVQEAEKEFAQASRAEWAAHQDKINKKIGKVMDAIKNALSTFLEPYAEPDEIDLLANEIEDRVTADVYHDLNEKTKNIVETESDEMEAEAEAEVEDEDTTESQAKADLEGEKKELLADLEESVDEAVKQVLGNLKHNAVLVAKEMIAAFLKTQTGHSFTVIVDEMDTIVGVKRKSSTATKAKTKTTSTHTSTTHTSSGGSTSSSTTKKKKKKKKKKTSHTASTSTYSTPKVEYNEEEDSNDDDDEEGF